MFTGDRGMPVFEVGHYSYEESKEKIIHLLSCSTAIELGSDMTQHGCLAFFGYDAPFIYVPDISEVFWECDSEIDRAFAQGMSAGEVYERATERYQQCIQNYKDKHITALINGEERETVALLKRVFSLLEYNYNHLCSPSVDRRWGNVEVTLMNISKIL